jgi:hypothetical protein
MAIAKQKVQEKLEEIEKHDQSIQNQVTIQGSKAAKAKPKSKPKSNPKAKTAHKERACQKAPGFELAAWRPKTPLTQVSRETSTLSLACPT